MRKLNYRYFYLFYFVFNLINSYILTSGIFHPNISNHMFTWNHFIPSLIGNIGVLLIFLSISLIFLNNTRSRIRFLTIMSFIFMFICVGQATFANIFSTFFKFSHLKSFNNPTQSKYVMFYFNYAFQMLLNPTQFVHLIPFVLLCISRLFIIKESGRIYSPGYKMGLLLGSLLFMISPILLLNNNIEKTIYNNSISGSYGSHSVGLYNYIIYDFIDFMAGDKIPVNEKQKQEIDAYLVSKENSNIANPYTGIASDKNFLLVQLEAFNDFVIGLEVEDVNGDIVSIAPFLTELANKSLRFDRFYSSTGIGNTSDSEFSAMTGLYANGNDLTIFDFAKDNYHTLAKDFKTNGYETMSFHGNVGDFYRRNVEHIETLGFQTHYSLEFFQETNPDAPLIHGYLDDQYFLPEVVKELSTKDKFFGMAITVTSHSPYVPINTIKHHEFNDLTYLANNYLDFVIHVDKSIELLINEMDKLGILDNTVIAFYGDHTSSLFKQDIESIFNRGLTEAEFRTEMQNVPFILYNEDIITPSVNHKVGGTVNIYPTIANLFNLNPTYMFSNDLLSDNPGFSYNPRNLDLIFDDMIVFYPSQEAYSSNGKDKLPKNEIVNNNIKFFEQYKYINDLILKSDYFK